MKEYCILSPRTIFYNIALYDIIPRITHMKRGSLMLPIWQNRPLMVTIIVIIVLFAVLIITAGDNNMSGTESVVGSLLAPVQNGLYSATDATSDFFGRIFSGADLRTEKCLA